MTVSSRSLYRNWRPVTVEEMKGFIALVLNLKTSRTTGAQTIPPTFPSSALSSPGISSSRSLACCMWGIQMGPPSAAPCLTVSVQCLRPPSHPTSRLKSMSLINFKGSLLSPVPEGKATPLGYQSVCTVPSRKRAHYGTLAHPPLWAQFPAKV